MLKMYIAVLDKVPDNIVPTLVAHAVVYPLQHEIPNVLKFAKLWQAGVTAIAK